jgi:PIN domain nuclease of toxin-antitoxin system
VLDASAVLALLFGEPGAEAVAGVLSRATVSTVNWVEVWQRCRTVCHDPTDVRDRLLGVGLVITALSAAQAERAGELREATSHLGLSLADRCCLALALDNGLPVLTADGTWAQADVGADVVVIR